MCPQFGEVSIADIERLIAEHAAESPPGDVVTISDVEELIAEHAANLDAHTRNLLTQWLVGQYYFPYSGAATVNDLAANYIFAQPLHIARALTIDRIACHITVQAGQKIRMGIYADNGSTYPGTLIKDAGEITLSAAGVQAITLNPVISLAKGLYWTCITSNGTPTIRALSSTALYPSPMGIMATAFNNPNASYAKDLAYAALPNSFPTGAALAYYYYLVLVRIASLA